MNEYKVQKKLDKISNNLMPLKCINIKPKEQGKQENSQGYSAA